MIGKVLFTKKNPKGIYGFIKCEDGVTHYFDTSGIVKGNYIKPSAEVEFEVIPSRGGKTQAINVRLVKKSIEYPSLEVEKLAELSALLEKIFVDKSFVDCAGLPNLFRMVEIDYREYAEDLRSFIVKYLKDYSVQKKYTSDGKEYPMVLLHNGNEHIELTEEVCNTILIELKKMISENGFFQAMILPAVLKQVGIKSFRDYSPNMDSFLDSIFPGLFVAKHRVTINGKEYPKIYVPAENAELFKENAPSSTISTLSELEPLLIPQIVERLSKELEVCSYIPGGRMPLLLREAGIDNYKEYATSIEEFINKYLYDDFEMKKDELIDGKREPSIVVYKNSVIQFQSLKNMYETGDYVGFLNSAQFRNSNPLDLGVNGIELALKALAGYLNEDAEQFNLNAFHRILITSPTVAELKQYKDDDHIQDLGAQSAFIAMTSNEFSKVFANVHNGKKTLNNNWNGIIERFWASKNNLAIYLTALWIIISQKDAGIDLYIEEAFKEKEIKHLPLMLKVYSEFVLKGTKSVTLRLKKKIVGHCFDCNDIQTLIVSYEFFDKQTLPELSEVIEYISEDQDISSERLISWFHSDIGELIAEKITNYYWWKGSREGINSNLVRVLSTVLWEYPTSYYTAIIYNQSCPLFTRELKEQLLANNFDRICEETKSYKKAFVLVSFVYFNYIKPLGIESYDQSWSDLRSQMKSEVLGQLSNDIISSRAISIFKYDPEMVSELETYYCDTFVSDQVNGIVSEDELDDFISNCEENNLSFITQWVIKHTSDVGLTDKEQQFRSILASKQYAEALLFVQRENSFSNTKKIELIKDILCQNFEQNMLDEAAFHIFENAIPANIAERIISQKISFADSSAIMSLIILYSYQSEWIKALYLFIPFKKIHRNTHLKFIEDFNSLLSAQRIRQDQYDSHLDIMRAALKVFDSSEFDSFIKWAQGFSIPSSSRVYAPRPQIFDTNLQAMLKGGDYNVQWKQLTLMALRTDNNEKQDSLRYSIITSYIGRYGLAEFDSLITELSRKRVNSKGYIDFYMSLWKGLLGGKYSANFLRISRPLISCAPLTFWNIFYDVAACKNHVFSSSDFELSKLNGLDHQIQAFYEDVLKRYSYTRETVFAKIALRILNDSVDLLAPMFEQYIPYCSSNQNKDLILSTIIRLISQNRYLEELSVFLEGDYWRCTETEAQLLRAAQALCVNDSSYFLGDDLSFSSEEVSNIFSDLLECVINYPDVRMTRSVFERIQNCSNTYQYRLAELLIRMQQGKLQEAYLHRVTKNVPQINNLSEERTAVKYYLEFMSTMYKKQLNLGAEDVVYIRNRYYRILAADVLASEDRKTFSDDEIIALMQRNRHFNAVYSDYKALKALVIEFATSEILTENQIEFFLLGFISNNWGQFINEIASFDNKSLELIRTIESYTNYRDLNIYFLKEFIYDHAPEDATMIPYIEICSPLIASVMKDIRSIYLTRPQEYNRCKAILVGICHLDDIDRAKAAYLNLQKYLLSPNNELQEHWDMYMNALLATSYVKTMINILADEVRRRRIDVSKVLLWRPVFVAMKEVPAYYYLLSVRYATEKNYEEAKKAYTLIPTFDGLPEEWNVEHADLQAYLSRSTNYFYPSVGSAVATLSIEKDATNISFIQTVIPRNDLISQSNEPNVDLAVKAYKTIIRSDIEDVLKYSSYQQLFSYVKRPEDLYEVFRQVEGRTQSNKTGRSTFNELVIEFGSLIITLDDQLSYDQKLDILIEIFDVFSFLNDINKGKRNIVSRLVSAEQIVLETPGIHFEKWIKCKDEIQSILSESFIGNNTQDVDKWLVPIDECLNICSSNNSETELLLALENWRQNWNSLSNASNFENAFIRSIDEKILALKNGINLAIIINNTTIEDEGVFYQIRNTSPFNNVSVSLSNNVDDAAHLIVEIGINNSPLEKFEDAEFSSELILRPNDSCGQYYKLPSKVTRLLKEGDLVTVILKIVFSKKVICDNSHQKNKFKVESIDEALVPSIISNRSHYGTAVPAFSTSIKGFGREKEKSDLRELLESNLAIIYGPSRVGKSSLLNYIANEYFNDYCPNSGCNSIMQIRVADEQFSKNDYITNMLSDGEPLHFESSAQIIEYLFCTPLLIAFSEDSSIRKMQMCKTAISSFPDEARAEITEILSKKGSIVGKYGAISRVLSNYNCELWIMFDEFQQVVERWIGSADELAELCTFIKYNQISNSIKLIICGSDDLVRIFECVHDDNWDEFKVKTADTWVFVGQLSDQDFASMMNDRTIWRDLPYITPWNMDIGSSDNVGNKLPAVLQSLYDYTGGNAICGKIFGEELLEKVKNGKFSHRRFFYPADITQITFELLNAETSKLKNLLITHTTKNLQNELPYLLYIASEMSADINKADVSLRKILEFFQTKDSADVETALKVLIARGIIKTTTEPHRYGFTTLFYFDFFKDLATDSAMQKLRDSENHNLSYGDPAPWLDQVVEIVRSQPIVDRADIAKIIDSREDDGLKSGIGELYGKGTTIHAGTYIGENTGTSIGTQNNVQINAQTINTAFNTLLDASATGEMLLQAFHSLPSLSAYIPETEKTLVSGKTTQLLSDYDAYDACFSENGQCTDAALSQKIGGRIAETEGELESINVPAEKKMISDTMGAVIASDAFMDVSEQRWEELLKISPEKVSQLRKLPAEISTPLSFAVVLHNVFDEVYSGIVQKKANGKVDVDGIAPDKMDFCPVAIMYCKIVESILKKVHTPLYIKGLGEKSLKLGGSAVFSDLGSPDDFNEDHKELSIGSYVSHLVFLPKKKISLDTPMRKPSNNDFRFGVMTFGDTEEDYNDNIRRLIDDSDTEDEKIGPWKVHARALKIIQEIRNRSAHEAIPITKENFDWLIEVLFEKGEFLRIWELSK